VNIILVERLDALFLRAATRFFPHVTRGCCSQKDTRCGRLSVKPRPEEILDVSVPYALSSYELFWMGGGTGRWFLHLFISLLHALLSYQTWSIDLPFHRVRETPEVVAGRECYVDHCAKSLQ
jgi:hypothetical protein